MSQEINLITKNGTARLHGDSQPGHKAPAQIIPLTSLTRGVPVERKAQLDIVAVQARLSLKQGRGYWRSLEELAATEEFHDLLEREFPHTAPRDMTPMSRREFVRLMGASLALAGVAGCAFQPAEKIVPYVEMPENIIPGKPLFYATAISLGGYAIGVLAESHLGRPVKLEGNPSHPGSLGATDTWTQAALLGLYDPDRSQTVRRAGEIASWDAFYGDLVKALTAQRAKRGAGLRILTETVTSPTVAAQLAQLQTFFPEARWHQYEAVTRDNVREGSKLAFGEIVNTIYRFDQADVVVSLDSNFLQEEPGRLVYAKDFAAKRSAEHITEKKGMSRFFAVESLPTITGALADNRLPLRAADVEAFALALAAKVGVSGVSGAVPTAGVPGQDAAKWVEVIAADLKKAAGSSLVIAGEHQPAAVHALAHAINAKLGNAGKTVVYTAPVEASPVNQSESLKNLTADLAAGKVDVMLVVGGNPAYGAPGDVKFAEALLNHSKNTAKFSAHLGLYFDESAALCQWHVPETHTLEAWGDTRAFDGTISIQQPLIVPLYDDAKSQLDFVAACNAPSRSAANQSLPGGLETVRTYWKGKRPSGDFEMVWNKWVHDGLIDHTKALVKPVALRSGFAVATGSEIGEYEISFRTDPSVYDGRFANNAWLQELPRPLTKLVWDNAAHVSMNTARELGVAEGDVLTLKTKAGTGTFPAWITPGHPDKSITVHLGYGRKQGGKVLAGEVGDGVGYDANLLRSSAAQGIATVEIAKTGRWAQLVSTQQHHLLDDPSAPKNAPGQVDSLAGRGHDILQTATLGEYLQGHFPHPDHEAHHSMYPPMWPSDIATQNQWKSGEAEGGHGAESGHGAKGGSGGLELQEVPHDSKDGIDRSHSQWPETVPQGFPKAQNFAQHQWGMSIDLNVCTGCNGCTIACQAENNIATVGKTMVSMNREMHWLRIDTYYQGSVDNPQPYFQPMMCQHCEKAPCEPVCPVEATAHSAEGINEMTYNRCIGTKYCSNNCPYKVRRFNFLQWADQTTPTIQMMRNPDVTVRSRGVMEKCTFCVQRVNSARIQAEREDRAVREGEVKTACQQSCPTNAIVFGNLIQKDSSVRRLREHAFSFSVLPGLATHPRVTYLAKIRNPHPDLESSKAGGE